jgi:hypothetical protein
MKRKRQRFKKFNFKKRTNNYFNDFGNNRILFVKIKKQIINLHQTKK